VVLGLGNRYECTVQPSMPRSGLSGDLNTRLYTLMQNFRQYPVGILELTLGGLLDEGLTSGVTGRIGPW